MITKHYFLLILQLIGVNGSPLHASLRDNSWNNESNRGPIEAGNENRYDSNKVARVTKQTKDFKCKDSKSEKDSKSKKAKSEKDSKSEKGDGKGSKSDNGSNSAEGSKSEKISKQSDGSRKLRLSPLSPTNPPSTTNSPSTTSSPSLVPTISSPPTNSLSPTNSPSVTNSPSLVPTSSPSLAPTSSQLPTTSPTGCETYAPSYAPSLSVSPTTPLQTPLDETTSKVAGEIMVPNDESGTVQPRTISGTYGYEIVTSSSADVALLISQIKEALRQDIEKELQLPLEIGTRNLASAAVIELNEEASHQRRFLQSDNVELDNERVNTSCAILTVNDESTYKCRAVSGEFEVDASDIIATDSEIADLVLKTIKKSISNPDQEYEGVFSMIFAGGASDATETLYQNEPFTGAVPESDTSQSKSTGTSEINYLIPVIASSAFMAIVFAAFVIKRKKMHYDINNKEAILDDDSLKKQYAIHRKESNIGDDSLSLHSDESLSDDETFQPFKLPETPSEVETNQLPTTPSKVETNQLPTTPSKVAFFHSHKYVSCE